MLCCPSLGAPASSHHKLLNICVSVSAPRPRTNLDSRSRQKPRCSALKHSQNTVFAALQQNRDTASLPQIDWTRYHLQVLFVDRSDTVRARVATGLFERIAEWNGYGRALYPWACGVSACQTQPVDFSTTASLFSQATFLGIRAKLFAAPAEQLTLEDLDRYDVVCALGSDIKHDIISMVQPEWHGYYDAKVCTLDQFSDYVGDDILRTGGTAILESELSNIIRPVLQDSKDIPELLRPSLHKGADEWNSMIQAMIISCAGLVQYLIDAYPPDLPHYDPL